MTAIEIEKIRREIARLAEVNKQCGSRPFTEGVAAGYADVLSYLDTLEAEESGEDKQILIYVRCANPYDETWEKGKLYKCNIWHNHSLNHTFYDVYYDYGKNPNCVQFGSLDKLLEEFLIDYGPGNKQEI